MNRAFRIEQGHDKRWSVSTSRNGFQWWDLGVSFRRKSDAQEAVRTLRAIVDRGDAK